MKLYRSIFEKRLQIFKAWFHPGKNIFNQFYTIEYHTDYFPSIKKALKDGWVRIYVTLDEINIDTYRKPTEEQFRKIQDLLVKNSFVRKKMTNWSTISPKAYYIFKGDSIFRVNSFSNYSRGYELD